MDKTPTVPMEWNVRMSTVLGKCVPSGIGSVSTLVAVPITIAVTSSLTMTFVGTNIAPELVPVTTIARMEPPVTITATVTPIPTRSDLCGIL